MAMFEMISYTDANCLNLHIDKARKQVTINNFILATNDNLLLNEREGRTGEYWPEVVTVRTERQYLALINRAGGLYGRILTEVVSTDRMQ